MKVTIWHAKWCAPCKGTIQTLVPLFKEENILYELMDIDEHPCAARKANICYLPTVIVGDSSGELMRVHGLPDERATQAIIEDHPRVCGEHFC